MIRIGKYFIYVFKKHPKDKLLLWHVFRVDTDEKDAKIWGVPRHFINVCVLWLDLEIEWD